jgi:hypothetical protein
MYPLLNTLKLGVDSILVDETDKEAKDKLDEILRLDFMSHFVFRLFENLNVKEDDPSRFNLEIMVNRGAAVSSKEIVNVKNHCIKISLDNYIDVSKKLNLEKLKIFLQTLADLDISMPHVSTENKKDKKDKKDKKEKKAKDGSDKNSTGSQQAADK